MTDELISDILLQALRYVQLVNDGGAGVEPDDLDRWMSLPEPNALSASSSSLGPAIYGLIASLDRRGYAEYLQMVGWTTRKPMRLTPVGRAVLKAHIDGRGESIENERALIILSPQDPLNLVSLTSAVAAARAGLLVDPYFSDELFAWLLEATSIERVLLCRAPEKRATLRLVAGAAERIGRTLEIRCLPPREIHDRYMVAEGGEVSSIGASLNGLSRNFTTISVMPEPAAQAIRDYLDEKWVSASQIEPQFDLRGTEPASEPGATPSSA